MIFQSTEKRLQTKNLIYEENCVPYKLYITDHIEKKFFMSILVLRILIVSFYTVNVHIYLIY